MARNGQVPRPRRRARRERAHAAATTSGAAAPEAAPAAPVPDDTLTVYAWLTRLTTDPAETERLLVEILRRSRSGGPACVRAASDITRLQFLTVQAVLRGRGVL
jgi:hypothetical protein